MTSVSYPQSGSESDNIKLADPDTDLLLGMAVTLQLIKIAVFFHTPYRYLVKKSLKSVSRWVWFKVPEFNNKKF